MVTFLTQEEMQNLPEGTRILSQCCGETAHEYCDTICSLCRDHTGFNAYDEDGNDLGAVMP